jgi:hypothetical protein
MADALERLKQQRRQSRKQDECSGGSGCDHATQGRTAQCGQGTRGPACSIGASANLQRHQACASDAENDAYMRLFEEGLRVVGSGPQQQPRQQLPWVGTGCSEELQPQQAQSTRHPRASGSASGRGPVAPRPPAPTCADSSSLGPALPPPSTSPLPRGAAPWRPLAASWRAGPTAAVGRRCQLSERPLICSAARWQPRGREGEVVLGSADHGLYVVDAATAKRRRTLYTKSCGHKE